MKIDRYTDVVQKRRVRFEEWLQSNGTADLARSLSELGTAGLDQLKCQHPDLIHDIAIAQPGEWPNILHRIPDEATRSALLILALHHLRMGEAWLTCAAERAADTAVDIHPLSMAMRAAEAADQFLADVPAIWPFDDGRDPLGEDL